MMKQGLSLKFSQNLALTPQLQQAIKLLQMSQLELQETLQEQAESNPFLVLEPAQLQQRIGPAGTLMTDTASVDASSAGMQEGCLNADSTQPQDTESELNINASVDWDGTSDAFGSGSDAKSHDANDSEDSRFEWVADQATNLLEHLQSQIRFMRLDEPTRLVLNALIECVDEQGYLSDPMAILKPAIAHSLDVYVDSFFEQIFDKALALLHQCDPPGVGAFDLQQCLLLQLHHPNAADCVLDVKVPVHRLAEQILTQGFALLGGRDRTGLKKLFKCDDAILVDALTLIRRLEPKPGLIFQQDDTEYVQPEILVIKALGAWQARLNPAVVPALRVQNTHAKYLKRGVAQTEPLYQQLQGAKQLVRTVQQHFETVFRVGQSIVAMQQSFFEHGAIKIKPMVLKDVADSLGLHESTVSRVTTRKYIQTPQGVFEMKYFFSGGLMNEEGENTSSTAIKAYLSELLKGEPTHKPYSDQWLTDALNEHGYQVARRTVAKYREQLGYAPAHARKPL